MVGWHHRLNGHEFEQIPGDSKGQGSLASQRVGQKLVTEQQALFRGQLPNLRNSFLQGSIPTRYLYGTHCIVTDKTEA